MWVAHISKNLDFRCFSDAAHELNKSTLLKKNRWNSFWFDKKTRKRAKNIQTSLKSGETCFINHDKDSAVKTCDFKIG